MPDEQAAQPSRPDSTADVPSPARRRRDRAKKQRPVRDCRYFYENTSWRLTSTAVWVLLVIGGIVAVTLVGMSASDDFLGQANLQAMLRQFLLPALLVPGMVLIVLAGGVDLSVAAVAGLTAAVVTQCAPQVGAQAAVWRGLGVAAGIGLVNGLLVSVARIHGAVATLGSMFAVMGITQAVAKSASGPVPAESLGFIATLPDSSIPWIALGVVGVVGILLVQLTPVGRRPQQGEVREPLEGALARGLCTIVPYVLSGLAAGAVGVYLIKGAAAMTIAGGAGGYALPFIVLTAAVLGGTPVGGRHGTVLGGLLGCLLLVVGTNVANLKQVPAEQVLIGHGAVLLVAAVLVRMFFGVVSWRFERK